MNCCHYSTPVIHEMLRLKIKYSEPRAISAIHIFLISANSLIGLKVQPPPSIHNEGASFVHNSFR